MEFTKKKCREVTSEIKLFMKNGAKALDNVAGFRKIDENVTSKLNPILMHINCETPLIDAMKYGHANEEYVTYERYKLFKEQEIFDDEFYSIDFVTDISDKNLDFLATLNFYSFN